MYLHSTVCIDMCSLAAYFTNHPISFRNLNTATKSIMEYCL